MTNLGLQVLLEDCHVHQCANDFICTIQVADAVTPASVRVKNCRIEATGSGIRAIGAQPNYKLWLEGTTIEAVTGTMTSTSN